MSGGGRDVFEAWGRVLRGVRAVVTAVVVLGALGGGLYVWWTWDLDEAVSAASVGESLSADVRSGEGKPAEGEQRSRHVVAADAAARDVVAAWDTAREQAWARGDVEALGALYRRGSSAGESDMAALTQWQETGWHASGVAPRLLAVEEVKRGPRRLEVVVTEQFDTAVARSLTRKDAVVLPRGGPRQRRIVLTWTDASGWQVQRVSEPDGGPRPRSQ